MSQITVTARGSNSAFVLKASLSLSIAHLVAEAFTDKYDTESPIHELLVRTFGKQRFRWYAADMSAAILSLTFSSLPNPPVLVYNKLPAQIVNPEWVVWLQEVDLVRPGRLNPRAQHPHFIERA